MTKEIRLNNGMVTFIDAEDYDSVSKCKWQAKLAVSGKYYAVKNGTQRLHRLLMNAPAGMQVDHINGDTLDNRKSNLRLCTHAQNQMNRPPQNMNKTSPYKGVSIASSWERGRIKKWKVAIDVNKKRIFVGYFPDEIEAAKAYDAAATKYHGEFAYLNFAAINEVIGDTNAK